MAETLADLTLFVGVPLLFLAILLLWYLVWKFRNPVTVVQAISVSYLFLHAAVFAGLFKNNDQPVPWLDVAATKIIARSIEFGSTFVALAVLGLFLWPILQAFLRRRAS